MSSKVYQQIGDRVLESKFQKHVKKVLKEAGVFCFVKEAKSLRGLPDIIGCHNGRFFAWELKRSVQEARKRTGRIVLQRHILKQIRHHGGIGEIVHPDNLDKKLQDLLSVSPKPN